MHIENLNDFDLVPLQKSHIYPKSQSSLSFKQKEQLLSSIILYIFFMKFQQIP